MIPDSISLLIIGLEMPVSGLKRSRGSESMNGLPIGLKVESHK